MAEREAALLGGVNVGGRHSVTMAAVTEVFASLGCTEVATYIQSGNVVFVAPESADPAEHAPAVAVAKLTAQAISAALEARFGFPVPTVVLSAAELRAVIEGNPFARPSVDHRHLHAVFLAGPMPPASEALLRAAAAPTEEFAAGDQVLYFHLPNGVARSKLALVPGMRKFGVAGTMRNWATVLKLGQMVGR